MFSVAEDQKVDIASMYLVGKAETWYDGYILQKHRTTWPEFVVDLCQWFCDRTCADVVEEFNKLVQQSIVEYYQEKF